MNHPLQIPVDRLSYVAQFLDEGVVLAGGEVGHSRIVRAARGHQYRKVGQFLLVGDTPGDVTAGLRAGVRVIGVATGETTVHELRDAGATWAVDDLEQAGNVIAALLRARVLNPPTSNG